MAENPKKRGSVLITGATGYVGGRLVPKLLEAGYRVRALGRSLEKLGARSWAGHPMLELVQADVMDLDSLTRACEGCWAVFYLVHSMNPQTEDFAAADRTAAENMARAAKKAGVERIIYLGGLVPDVPRPSKHLLSRAEVGAILGAGETPVTFLRAAMILGSGSASFEIMRYLVERLPVMVVPQWVTTRVQPISIRNVLGYLAGALEHDEMAGQAYDIGGPDILRYIDLFRIYAREAGLRPRLIIPLPLMNVRLSSYWIHMITPIHAAIARPLAEGLSNTVTCKENRIREIIPQDLLDCPRAIRRSLEKRAQQIVETCWTDAGALLPPEWTHTGDAHYSGGTVIRTAYAIRLKATPEQVWEPVARIGGETGWYFANFLWRLRGWLDKLAGGVSLRRGRRHPSQLVVGDALDFWRVLEVRPARRLLLVGEMRAPGEAVLDFNIKPIGNGVTELALMGRFLPAGLSGLAYWYALLPFHAWIYKGLLKAIARRTGRPIVQAPKSLSPVDEG